MKNFPHKIPGTVEAELLGVAQKLMDVHLVSEGDLGGRFYDEGRKCWFRRLMLEDDEGVRRLCCLRVPQVSIVDAMEKEELPLVLATADPGDLVLKLLVRYRLLTGGWLL